MLMVGIQLVARNILVWRLPDILERLDIEVAVVVLPHITYKRLKGGGRVGRIHQRGLLILSGLREWRTNSTL